MPLFVVVTFHERKQAVVVRFERRGEDGTSFIIDDVSEPRLTHAVLDALRPYVAKRDYHINSDDDYRDTYCLDPVGIGIAPKLVGHPIQHPHVPNTEQWILNTLRDLINNNQRHYNPRVAKLMAYLANGLETYINSLEF